MTAAVVVCGAVGVSVTAATSASAAPIKQVRYQGLRVLMPGASAATPVPGGNRIGLLVRPIGPQPKSRPSARVTVTRAASGGEKAATLVRKSLRNGEVRFLLSGRVGVKYRIQVQIGKRRWVTRLVTADEIPGERPPAEATIPCVPSGTITADVSTVAAGGTIPFHVTNTGTTPLALSGRNGWSQLVDGLATPVLSPGGIGGQTGIVGIAPGETKFSSGAVWPTLTPGSYSMTLLSTCNHLKPDGSVAFVALPLQTAPITVTAAAGR